MDIAKLKNFKFKIPHRTRKEFRTIGEKANHDWRLILVSFLILSIGAVAVSFYLFIKVSKGEIFTVAQESANIRTEVDADTLELVTKYFEERRDRLNDLRASPPRKTDPSL